MPALTKAIREQLEQVSVATITTTLFKRGLRNQLIQDVLPVCRTGGKRKLIGPAYTLRYMPAREDLNKLEVFRNREHPQRKAIEECPPGHVMVIDSRKDARAASAGSILITRLQERGVAGVVTDGGFRDSPDIAQLDMPAYHLHPAPPTNLTHHQAIDINVPIGCGDAPVYPGDIIFGDDEGVVVIPAHLVAECAQEAFDMTAFEDFVTEQVKAGRSVLGLYPATDPKTPEEFAAWRMANNR
jgi:regulator of RNase E activity RraA